MAERIDADATCVSCGSTWWRLLPPKGAGPEQTHGVVTMDQRGMITGYGAEVVCDACGDPWGTPEDNRSRLRLVEPSSLRLADP